MNLSGMFYMAAPHLPAVAMLFVLSLQWDILRSIARGNNVDIRARIIDFMHWLLLVSVAVGTWLSGDTSQWWTIVMILTLGVIGASVGFGVYRQKIRFTSGERISAAAGALCAVGIGICAYLLRTDSSMAQTALRQSYGWWLDTASGFLSIVLVWGFIDRDLRVIRIDWRGYSRSMFLKGIFCNSLMALSFIGALTSSGEPFEWTLAHFGFSFVVIVGNALYLWYYASYEYYRTDRTLRKLGY